MKNSPMKIGEFFVPCMSLPFLLHLHSPAQVYGFLKDTVGKLGKRSKIEAEVGMCLKIRPAWSMPAETKRIGQKLLKEKEVYRLIGDQLFERWHEEEYADLYSAEGKPGISPVILALVSVFQFMEKLADRQAVNALRMRLDWKYALHLPLEDAGFDYSVLSEFRDRLIAGQAEGRVFEKLVEEIRGMGNNAAIVLPC